MAPLGTGRFRRERLRELRDQKGWSQAKLGRKIGAHVTSISDWERGDNAPSGRHVASLAREFGVPVEQFYSDEEEDSSLQSMSDEDWAMYGRLHARASAELARTAERSAA